MSTFVDFLGVYFYLFSMDVPTKTMISGFTLVAPFLSTFVDFCRLFFSEDFSYFSHEIMGFRPGFLENPVVRHAQPFWKQNPHGTIAKTIYLCMLSGCCLNAYSLCLNVCAPCQMRFLVWYVFLSVGDAQYIPQPCMSCPQIQLSQAPCCCLVAACFMFSFKLHVLGKHIYIP